MVNLGVVLKRLLVVIHVTALLWQGDSYEEISVHEFAYCILAYTRPTSIRWEFIQRIQSCAAD